MVMVVEVMIMLNDDLDCCLIFGKITVLITFGDDGNCGRDTTATTSVRADGSYQK